MRRDQFNRRNLAAADQFRHRNRALFQHHHNLAVTRFNASLIK
jgi:hypothetical protein